MPPAIDVQRFVVAEAEQMTLRVRDELGIIMIAFQWIVTRLLLMGVTRFVSEWLIRRKFFRLKHAYWRASRHVFALKAARLLVFQNRAQTLPPPNSQTLECVLTFVPVLQNMILVFMFPSIV